MNIFIHNNKCLQEAKTGVSENTVRRVTIPCVREKQGLQGTRKRQTLKITLDERSYERQDKRKGTDIQFCIAERRSMWNELNSRTDDNRLLKRAKDSQLNTKRTNVRRRKRWNNRI